MAAVVQVLPLVRLIANRLNPLNMPGATVAVSLDGQPVLASGFGTAARAARIPMAGSARFYLYSVSKPVIATMVLQRVDAGEIGLDNDIQLHLPYVALPWEMTVRQLLQHTGGLRDYGPTERYQADVRANPGGPWSRRDFLDAVLGLGRTDQWHYANVGYMLLGMAVEETAGVTLDHQFQLTLAQPLGLRRTNFATELGARPPLTPGWSTWMAGSDQPVDIARSYHPGWVSHQTLISDAGETLRLFDALFGGQLLSADLMREMLTAVPVPHQHPQFRRPSYGLGLMLDPDSPWGLLAGHGGGGPGYNTAVLHAPDVAGRQVTAVVLLNGDANDVAMELAYALIDAIGQQLD